MRSSSSLVVAVSLAAVLSACGEGRTAVAAVVMTQNLGLGADLDAVLASSTADMPALVDAMWADKDRSTFVARADAIAKGIADYMPDVVGLQSVVQWRRQVPASGAPAEELVTDYLELLLSALAARGMSYDPVAVVTTSDIELTGASGNDYRLVDRIVILTWAGLKTANASGGTYAASRTIATGGGTIEDRRGWASVIVEREAKAYRFVSTRLEATDGDVQRAQSLELAQVLGQDVATVLAGDLASDIDQASSPGYRVLVGPGSRFSDAVASAGAGFPSCCRDAGLVDPAARLARRGDYVLVTNHFLPAWGSWVHGNGTAMTGGIWPSSHAGILAGMWFE